MKTLPVGTKVRCISDSWDNIKIGKILTIKKVYPETYSFKEINSHLYFHKVEPLERTIRDVVEGDVVVDKINSTEDTVLAVGKDGFCVDWEDGLWFTWEEAEESVIIKQPEVEKQEIEKLGWGITTKDLEEVAVVYKQKINEIINKLND